ncbi:MAG TPA: hypothetical protein VFE32_04395 [Puia sp.]|jgi:hypothetical protein|nr:hypothetical protein [Puia sp.]
MKRLLFIGALTGAGVRTVNAQTIAAMAEQINQLKLFEHSTVAGYHMASNGLDSIGRINEAEYLLHVNYFNSLDAANPNIGVDPAMIKKLNSLVLEIKNLLHE